MLDWAGQSSKYSRYSCGWPSQSALTLNPIEGFETSSKHFQDRLLKKKYSSVNKQIVEILGSFSSKSLKRAEWIFFFLNRMLFDRLRNRWKEQANFEIVSLKEFKMMNLTD